MEKTSTKGWEIFFSTYPTKEKKSEEKIIISDKHDFNEALKESIDKLNLKDLDETENIEEKHAFLDKVINLENNTTSSGVEASLAFQITKAFDKKEQSGKYYQLHHHDSIDRVFGTFKEKKESVIVLKGVDLNEHMKKLIRNIIISFLFILVPSLLHFFTAENVLGSIFVLLTTSSLTIVFWLIFFEMNQRHSMTVLSAQIEVIAKKHY